MSSTERVIIFRTKANRFEDVEVSHETYKGTTVVSVRRYRGENFTGKGVSLRPELFEQLLPEIVKAIQSSRHVFTTEVGTDAPLDADEAKRRYEEMIEEIKVDTSLTPQQQHDKYLAALEWHMDQLTLTP